MTNFPPLIVCATTASRCPRTSDSCFGGKTRDNHPSRKANNTRTAVNGAIGVTVHSLRVAGDRAPSVKEVSSDIVQSRVSSDRCLVTSISCWSQSGALPTPTSPDTTRADKNSGPSLAHTEHVCPADAHERHISVRKHPSSPANGVQESREDPPNYPTFHSHKPQFEYTTGHPVCMVDALSQDFQPEVPNDHPPNCGSHDGGDGAAT